MTVITIQLPGSPGSPGPKGDPGIPGVLDIGPVVTGAPGTAASATLSGVLDGENHQVLNLTIPRGDKGEKGDKGDNGISPTLASGTINTGAPGTNVVATLTGTYPNYLLNLTIPRGFQGVPGPATTIAIGTVAASDDPAGAAATLTGASPNQTLNLVLPRGIQGEQGIQGIQGETGEQGLPGIPGSAGGAGTGVPQGGLTGDVLSKLSGADHDTIWAKVAVLADPNSIMKRDANGNSVSAYPTTGIHTANMEYVDTKSAAEATAKTNTHEAKTVTHGATGAVVGTTNAQTLTNKTLTAPVQTSFEDFTEIATPGSPAAGRQRFYIDTALHGLHVKDSAGVVRRAIFDWGQGTAFPGAGMQRGDTYLHTGSGMHIFNGTSWRQTEMLLITEAQRLALTSAQMYDGFQVFETDTDRNWIWGGATWKYVGGGTDPSVWVRPAYENGWLDYDATYEGARYRQLTTGEVHIQGLVRAGTIGTPVFTLPVGMRPARQLLKATQTNANVVGRLDIQTNGGVQATVGSNAWFSIDCTFFPG